MEVEAASTAVYIALRYILMFKQKFNLPVDIPHIDREHERFHFGNIEWKFCKNRNIVIGAFVTFSTNMASAIGEAGAFQGPFGFGPQGMVIGATVVITAKYNPFFGMIAGILVKLVFGL